MNADETYQPPQREIAETPKQEKSQGMDIGLSP